MAANLRRVWLLGGHAADVRTFNASLPPALEAVPRQHLGMGAWQSVFAKEVLGGERGGVDAPSSGWTGVQHWSFFFLLFVSIDTAPNRPVVADCERIMFVLRKSCQHMLPHRHLILLFIP